MKSQDKSIQTNNVTQIKKRHYVHGDQSEINAEMFFCARCDKFQNSQHFFSSKEHSTRIGFISHLTRWKDEGISWRFETNYGEQKAYDGIVYYRYENSANLFRDTIKITHHQTIIKGKNNEK